MLNYYRRIFSAYLTRATSQLTFWHGIPRVNENASTKELGEYYMPFSHKADYQGHFDEHGIPLLDYKGKIGKQYNPIAIAQYGLGNYNQYLRTGTQKRLNIFLNQANWLVENLEKNPKGLWVWNHHFDWEYREILRAPWYSALSQGQGLSVLVRVYKETGKDIYMEAARRVFETFKYEIGNGGVRYTDEKGCVWLEEAIVDPPTHILNGFMWALWGVWDYYLLTKDTDALELFNDYVKTLKDNLIKYDIGFWSLYEQSGTKLKMIASYFYHSLHIVQLRVMFKITKNSVFRNYAERWEKYKKNRIFRQRALIQKSVFKLLYY